MTNMHQTVGKQTEQGKGIQRTHVFAMEDQPGLAVVDGTMFLHQGEFLFLCLWS